MGYNKRTAGLPLICLVCDDVARGINYNVMTCMPCKIFFRRHGLVLLNTLQCHAEGDCDITRETRAGCSACRLKKCFALGMNRGSICNRFEYEPKSNRLRRLQIMEKSNTRLLEPLPLSLLRNDRSTLTIDDWTLLSNIIHAYDATNIIPQTKYLFEQQSSLPIKIRSKSSMALDIIKFFYLAFGSFIERSPYFHDLSIDARQALILHNSETFGTFNSIFITREINALDNLPYITSFATTYGYDTLNYVNQFVKELEPNGTLVKIMLLIVAFSSNCSIVTPHYPENVTLISSSISLINIQNILVTTFWKYLIYQYGFVGAVQCFTSFIKYILGILQSTNEKTNVKHMQMIDTVVEETARSLTIDDGNLSKTRMKY